MGSYEDLSKRHLENLELIVSAAAPLPLADVNALLDKVKVSQYEDN